MEIAEQIFSFIFLLGFFYITFDLIWGLIRFLLRITLGVNSEDRVTYHLFKIFSYFVLVTLTAVITLKYELFLFYALGFLVLYFYITSRMQKNKLKAAIKMDQRMLKRVRFNSIYLLGSLVFFVLSVNIPALVENQLTDWFYNMIVKVKDIGLFRFVIGFFAIIFLVNVLYRGFQATRLLIQQLLGMEPKASNAYESSFGKEGRELEEEKQGEYIDYEEVEGNNSREGR